MSVKHLPQLKAYQAKVKAIDNLNFAKEARKQAIQDGQDMGKALLYAEAKLGDLLKAIDKSKSYTGFQQRNSVLPEGISKKQSHIAQKIADNLPSHEQTLFT